MTNGDLRSFLMHWQFWTLELQFALVVVTTFVEAPRLGVARPTVIGACALAICAWLLAASVPPRTNRIYYDEQIYQGVARNLSDLHRAQMCNDGSVEYGRFQCAQAEYNKEPYGYPYLLSILYRAAGVKEAAAFHLNNIVAGLTVFVAVLLADVLFRDRWIALLSGAVLSAFPMLLVWSNTAASEPSAALFSAASTLAAVHFARARTTSALTWTIALAAFTFTLRPECILIAAIGAAAVALLSPAEFATRRFWTAVALGAVVAAVPLLHAIAVSNEGWGAAGPSMSWRYAASNLSTNFWFYFADARFPAAFGIAAAFGAITAGCSRERALLATYFLAFWIVFLFFYAGSYNYGADVRYSVMTYVPVAILASVGLTRAARAVRNRWRPFASDSSLFASSTAFVAAVFLSYLPLVRATGEEAWAARADVRFAREFAAALPANSLVLTHNPSMFHIWNVSAAQLSLARTDDGRIRQLFGRYSGGVYMHWNFWCNVPDPLQNAFCRTALDSFSHELVDSRRERGYQFALYRLGVESARKDLK